MQRLINWFEIPAADFERGVAFYEKVLAVQLRREAMAGAAMAVFPYADPATGGAVCKMDMLQPGPTGALIYLDGGDDLAVSLGRVEGAGGKVLLAKTLIAPEIGYIAVFMDSEGNRVGLHSPH